MCIVYAVANQKGGCSKTSVTVNLGVGLAMEGKKVLVIDADPQGSLTISLEISLMRMILMKNMDCCTIRRELTFYRQIWIYPALRSLSPMP